MTDASPSPSAAAPLWLGLSRFSLVRRLGVLGGVGLTLSVWGREVVRSPSDRLALYGLVAPLAATLVLSSANHVGAQLVSRGVWWFHLLLGTVIAVSGHDREPAVIALGAGLALLSAGATGLGEGELSRGAFEPVAFRRSLMVSIAMAAAEVQLLTMGSGVLAHERSPGYAAAAAACALGLGLGAYGVFRLRFWGVLVHLVSMVGVASLVASALAQAPKVDPILVWVGTVSVQLLLPMPMLLAIVRRAPVLASSPSPWPPRLFFGLVGAMMASSAVSLAMRLRPQRPGFLAGFGTIWSGSPRNSKCMVSCSRSCPSQ